jgi:hypothetical protein
LNPCCPTAKDRKNRLEILPVLGIGVQGLLYQDNLFNIQQLQGTIILQTNLIHISVLNDTLFSKILSILSIQLHEKWKILIKAIFCLQDPKNRF